MERETKVYFDAPQPVEITARAEQVGVKKTAAGPANVFVLALLAGLFISFGGISATTATAGVAGTLPFGVTRVLAGAAFMFCLVLVVVTGAELFTGNTLMVVAWANRRITIISVLENWAVVYAGNFVGSVATALLMFFTGQYTFGKGAVGAAALSIANLKVSFGFGQAVALGILANILVCMAVWLSYSARTTTDRIFSIILPISAFVAAGFEHSIANMYLVPIGLFIKAGAPGAFWADIGKTPGAFPDLTWAGFLWKNLLPVTIGNIIGGSLVVGLAYWFAFLRQGKPGEARIAQMEIKSAQEPAV
jgi:formate/nitrite transporter